MKKIILGFGLICAATFAQAQTMLDGVVVEKFHVATPAEHTADPNLPVGAITYRIFVDMKPGVKLQSVYGDGDNRALKFSTSTTFYNQTSDGASNQAGVANNPSGVLKYDSWVSIGGAQKLSGSNKIGVLLSEDITDGVVDGNMTGTVAGFVTTSPVMDAALEASFNTVGGTSFSTSTDGYATTANAVGATASNMVLIGQFTTDGIFSYSINFQLNDGNNSEVYVWADAVSLTDGRFGEYTVASQKGTYNANIAPTVSLTTPAGTTSATEGDAITIEATANDLIGTDGLTGGIDKVEFYSNSTLIGTDNTAPYSISWTAVAGNNQKLTAKAYDNEGATTTSAQVAINVASQAPNSAPTVSLTSPANGATVLISTISTTLTITANAADADGTISGVEFFVNNVSIGTDATSPYSINWTMVEGSASIKAVATDNKSVSTTSSVVNITVFDPSKAPYKVLDGKAACNASDFIYVPVKRMADSIKLATGFDLAITFDKTKVTPTGIIRVNTDLIADSLYTSYAVNIKDTSMNVSLFLNSSAPIGTTFNGLGELMQVEFVKKGAFAAVDTVEFTVPSIMESYIATTKTVLVTKGQFITYKDSIYKGYLKFWADNSPIAYDKANPADHLITNIKGSKATAVQPDLNGMFSYDINNGGKIAVSRDIDATTDVMPVINGYDALMSQKVITEDETFIPSVYQIIAMDVNLDGVVSAGDVSQINQRTVLTIPQFTQVGGVAKDWLFVDDATVINNLSYRISNKYPKNDLKGYSRFKVPSVIDSLDLGIVSTTACPEFDNKTFKAILLGDVNGNYKNLTTANTNNYSSLKSDEESIVTSAPVTGTVIFDLTKAVATDGYINVPVYVSSKTDINSLDFAINYNENISFDKIVSTTASLKTMAYLNESDNTLRFTSYDFAALSSSNSIVNVRFAMSSEKVMSSDFTTVKAFLNGETASTMVSNVDGGVWNNNQQQVVTVYPIPTRSVLNVLLSQTATVDIIDVTGKTVMSIPSVQANENQIVNVGNLAAGVYTLKVYNEQSTSVHKVIVK